MEEEEESKIYKEIINKISSGVISAGVPLEGGLVKGLDVAKEQALREVNEILEMRKTWSRWILRFIGAIVLFDIALVSLYGWGIWKFDSPAVVIAVVTDNFLKIVGLGMIITHSIFQRIHKSQPSK